MGNVKNHHPSLLRLTGEVLARTLLKKLLFQELKIKASVVHAGPFQQLELLKAFMLSTMELELLSNNGLNNSWLTVM